VTAGDFWFALYTQPRKEYAVRDYLRGEGLHVYLPEVRNKVQRCDRRSCRPFFPHYRFLRDPGLEQLLRARWTPGLRRIIAYGGRPAMIPDQVIRQIRTRLRTFELPEEEPFKRGQVVRIVGGPFEGLNALFDRRLSDKDRVRVFLELVSRVQVPLEMDLRDLIPP